MSIKAKQDTLGDIWIESPDGWHIIGDDSMVVSHRVLTTNFGALRDITLTDEQVERLSESAITPGEAEEEEPIHPDILAALEEEDEPLDTVDENGNIIDPEAEETDEVDDAEGEFEEGVEDGGPENEPAEEPETVTTEAPDSAPTPADDSADKPAKNTDPDSGDLPPVLDPTSGARLSWYDKDDERALFTDNRRESRIMSDGRVVAIDPDIELDFRDLPFKDGAFKHVYFEPPSLVRVGPRSYMFAKYGKLESTWKDDLAKGFAEAFRVLEAGGVLVFKWSAVQIPVSQILALTEHKPLYGIRSGKSSNTHWIVFFKGE